MSIEERRLTTMLKFQKTLDGFASREIIQIKIYYTDMFLLFFLAKQQFDIKFSNKLYTHKKSELIIHKIMGYF